MDIVYDHGCIVEVLHSCVLPISLNVILADLVCPAPTVPILILYLLPLSIHPGLDAGTNTSQFIFKSFIVTSSALLLPWLETDIV